MLKLNEPIVIFYGSIFDVFLFKVLDFIIHFGSYSQLSFFKSTANLYQLCNG